MLKKDKSKLTQTMKNNEESKQLKRNDFNDITQRNWLMLKELEKGKTIQEAYRNAGYEGEYSAAYQMYHKLKKKLELVYDANNVDSLRLKIAAKKILDMEVEDKPVKAETKLKAIETLHKLQNKESEEKKAISPFIVFKESDGKIRASEGKVVHAEVIKSADEDKEAI